MNEISMQDKINVVVKLTQSNLFFLSILFVLILASTILIISSKKHIKASKRTFFIIYLIAIISLLVKYFTSLSTMFDYFMDNLFVVFYFPNIAVYIGAIVVTNIIMIKSTLSKKTKKIIKFINSLIFSIMNYLLVLILNVVSDRGLDVFEQSSLYGNKNVHSLIELSSNIFLVWIAFLVIYKVINSYLTHDEVVLEDDVRNIAFSDTLNKYNITLPDNVVATLPPVNIVRDIPTTKIVYEEDVTSKLENGIMSFVEEVKAPFVVKREMTKKEVVEKVVVKPFDTGVLSLIEKTQAPLNVVRCQTVKSFVNEKFDNSILALIKKTNAPINVKRNITEKVMVNKPYDEGILSLIEKTQSPLYIKREQTKEKVVYKDNNKYNTELYEKMLTVDDYKLLLSMLKDKQNSNINNNYNNTDNAINTSVVNDVTVNKMNTNIDNINNNNNKIAHDNEKIKPITGLSDLISLYQNA